MAVARRAVDLVMSTAASTQAGLAGAGGLVGPDGTVSGAAFTAYASEVTARSSLTSLAYRTRGAGRGSAPRYEQAVGRPIIDRAAERRLRPVPRRRAEHYPVQAVVPATAASRALDRLRPGRRPGAERGGRQGPGHRRRSCSPRPRRPSRPGATTFFIIKPLYRLGQPVTTVDQRRANIVGFVSTASVGTGLVGRCARPCPPAPASSCGTRAPSSLRPDGLGPQRWGRTVQAAAPHLDARGRWPRPGRPRRGAPARAAHRAPRRRHGVPPPARQPSRAVSCAARPS